MRALRNVHAITVLLAGFAFLMLLCGFLRVAVATVIIITCLHAWSLEMLRAVAGQRESK